ncbi:HAD-IA family hydrolase [uncultured Brevundimonas sp.]|uniref:HAD family hydrolase n=1 Tax=uncultured Brevundimonas sp. TaxID=213418 RepID=UPI0030ECABFF|tara:strand:- start:36079 stop:36828 length:750 start_codon:yes stop_codon:yes gene_type:complete
MSDAYDQRHDIVDGSSRVLTAAIFDVDGVLLASPHERAWREALAGLAETERFTTAMYQSQIAGKPRLDGARAALEALGVNNAVRHAGAYAERKQARLEELMRTDAIAAFPDALRFIERVAALGWSMAAASSSRNATEMMRSIRLSTDQSLLDVFQVNVSGREVKHGKPDPELFLIAAAELGVSPTRCLVVEDAPAGIQAARAGDMTALGVARLGDADQLRAAGSHLVVETLDEIALVELAQGRLKARTP